MNKNLILAKYMAGGLDVEDEHLDLLLELHDLHKVVYDENRIKKGFGQANIMAHQAVIDFWMKNEY